MHSLITWDMLTCVLLSLARCLVLGAQENELQLPNGRLEFFEVDRLLMDHYEQCKTQGEKMRMFHAPLRLCRPATVSSGSDSISASAGNLEIVDARTMTAETGGAAQPSKTSKAKASKENVECAPAISLLRRHSPVGKLSEVLIKKPWVVVEVEKVEKLEKTRPSKRKQQDESVLDSKRKDLEAAEAMLDEYDVLRNGDDNDAEAEFGKLDDTTVLERQEMNQWSTSVLSQATQRFQKPLNPFKEGYDKDH